MTDFEASLMALFATLDEVRNTAPGGTTTKTKLELVGTDPENEGGVLGLVLFHDKKGRRMKYSVHVYNLKDAINGLNEKIRKEYKLDKAEDNQN